MKYLNVKNPQWSSLEKKQIHCFVEFEGIGEVPFAADPNDIYDHTKEIYADCLSGKYGQILDYVPAPDEYPVVITEAENQPNSQGAQTL